MSNLSDNHFLSAVQRDNFEDSLIQKLNGNQYDIIISLSHANKATTSAIDRLPAPIANSHYRCYPNDHFDNAGSQVSLNNNQQHVDVRVPSVSDPLHVQQMMAALQALGIWNNRPLCIIDETIYSFSFDQLNELFDLALAQDPLFHLFIRIDIQPIHARAGPRTQSANVAGVVQEELWQARYYSNFTCLARDEVMWDFNQTWLANLCDFGYFFSFSNGQHYFWYAETVKVLGTLRVFTLFRRHAQPMDYFQPARPVETLSSTHYYIPRNVFYQGNPMAVVSLNFWYIIKNTQNIDLQASIYSNYINRSNGWVGSATPPQIKHLQSFMKSAEETNFRQPSDLWAYMIRYLPPTASFAPYSASQYAQDSRVFNFSTNILTLRLAFYCWKLPFQLFNYFIRSPLRQLFPDFSFPGYKTLLERAMAKIQVPLYHENAMDPVAHFVNANVLVLLISGLLSFTPRTFSLLLPSLVLTLVELVQRLNGDPCGIGGVAHVRRLEGSPGIFCPKAINMLVPAFEKGGILSGVLAEEFWTLSTAFSSHPFFLYWNLFYRTTLGFCELCQYSNPWNFAFHTSAGLAPLVFQYLIDSYEPTKDEDPLACSYYWIFRWKRLMTPFYIAAFHYGHNTVVSAFQHLLVNINAPSVEEFNTKAVEWLTANVGPESAELFIPMTDNPDVYSHTVASFGNWKMLLLSSSLAAIAYFGYQWFKNLKLKAPKVTPALKVLEVPQLNSAFSVGSIPPWCLLSELKKKNKLHETQRTVTNELTLQLKTNQQRFNQFQQEFEALRIRCAAQETILARYTTLETDYELHRITTTAQLSKNEEEQRHLIQDKEKLQREIETLLVQENQLKNELQEMETKLKINTQRISEQAEELRVQKDALQILTLEKDSLEVSFIALGDMNNTLKNEREELNQELFQTKTDLHQEQEKNDQLQQTLQKITADQNLLLQQCQDQDLLMKRKDDLILSQATELLELKKLLNESHDQTIQKQKENDDKSLQIKNFENQLLDLQNQIHQLTQIKMERDQMMQDKVVYLNEIDKAQQHYLKDQQTIADLVNELNQATAINQDLNNTLTMQSKEIATQRSDILLLNKKLQEVPNARETLRALIAQRTAEEVQLEQINAKVTLARQELHKSLVSTQIASGEILDWETAWRECDQTNLPLLEKLRLQVTNVIVGNSTPEMVKVSSHLLSQINQQIMRLQVKAEDIPPETVDPVDFQLPSYFQYQDYDCGGGKTTKYAVLMAPASTGKSRFIARLRSDYPGQIALVSPTAGIQSYHTENRSVDTVVKSPIIVIEEALRYNDSFIKDCLHSCELLVFVADIEQYTPNPKPSQIKRYMSYKMTEFKWKYFITQQPKGLLSQFNTLHRFNENFSQKIISTFYDVPGRTQRLTTAANANHSCIVITGNQQSLLSNVDQIKSVSTWIVLHHSEKEELSVALAKVYNVEVNELPVKVLTPFSAQGASAEYLGKTVGLYTSSEYRTPIYVHKNTDLLAPEYTDHDLEIIDAAEEKKEVGKLDDRLKKLKRAMDLRRKEENNARLLVFLTRSSTKTFLFSTSDSWKVWHSLPLSIPPIRFVQSRLYSAFEHQMTKMYLSKLPKSKKSPLHEFKFPTLFNVTLLQFYKEYKRFPKIITDFTTAEAKLAYQFRGIPEVAMRLLHLSNQLEKKVQDFVSTHISVKETDTTSMLPRSAQVSGPVDIAIVDAKVGESFTWEQYRETVEALKKKAKMILIKGWSTETIFEGIHIPTWMVSGRIEWHTLIFPDTQEIPFDKSDLWSYVSAAPTRPKAIGFDPRAATHLISDDVIKVTNPLNQKGETEFHSRDWKFDSIALRNLKLKSPYTNKLLPKEEMTITTQNMEIAPLGNSFADLPPDMRQLLIIAGVELHPGPIFTQVQWKEHFLHLDRLIHTRKLLLAQVHNPVDLKDLLNTPDCPEHYHLTAQNFSTNMTYRGVYLTSCPINYTSYQRTWMNDLQAAKTRLLRTKNPNLPLIQNLRQIIPIQALYDFWKVPTQIREEDHLSVAQWLRGFPTNRRRAFMRAYARYFEILQKKPERLTMRYMSKWDESLLVHQTYQKSKRARGLCIPPEWYLSFMGPVVNSIQKHFQRHMNFDNEFYFVCGANPLMVAEWEVRHARKFPFDLSLDVASIDASYFTYLKEWLIEILLFPFQQARNYNDFFDLFSSSLRGRIVNMENTKKAGKHPYPIFEFIVDGVLFTGELLTLLMNSLLVLLFVTLTCMLNNIPKEEVALQFLGDDHKISTSNPDLFAQQHSQLLQFFDYSVTGGVEIWEDSEFLSCNLYKLKNPTIVSFQYPSPTGTTEITFQATYIYDWTIFKAMKSLIYSTTNPIPIHLYLPQMLKSLSFHSAVPVFSEYYKELVAEWGVADHLEIWFLRKFPTLEFKMTPTLVWELDLDWWKDVSMRRHQDLTFQSFNLKNLDFSLPLDENIRADTGPEQLNTAITSKDKSLVKKVHKSDKLPKRHVKTIETNFTPLFNFLDNEVKTFLFLLN